jgi:hypothetical protein
MKIHLRVAAAGAALVLGSSASAHEFACEEAVGVVAVDELGAPLTGADAAPVFTAGPQPVLHVASYPAAVAFRIRLINVADLTSLVVGTSGPLPDDALAAAAVLGPALAPGFTLEPGASSDTFFVVAVDSFEACEALVAGRGAGGQCSAAAGDHAFAVAYPTGSAECRARIVCEPPAAPVTPDGPLGL